jgi:cytochrome c-type biogenesis protein CcmH/NrfG
MGWILMLLMALALVAGLWRFARLERGALQLVLAALMLALAGYAWQGRPGFDGQPKRAGARQKLPDTPFAALRRDVFGGFDRADTWLSMAEGYQRRGDTANAAGLIRSAIRANPQSATLWTGYGNALVLHGGGVVSPAADLAFRRAAELAPRHPGPHLFYGIALAENGRFADAERVWREALALAPPNAPWREGLAQQLRLIEEARGRGQIP